MVENTIVVSERDWQRTVEEAAAWKGWYCLHFPNAIINPPGWPDLICFRDGKTLIMELKGEKGRLGGRQKEMIQTLGYHGIVVHILRPSQWDEVERLLTEGP